MSLALSTCLLFILVNEAQFLIKTFFPALFEFASEAAPGNVVSTLESYSASLFEWILNNQMSSNTEKCDLLMNANRPATIKICEHTK